ncbi:outer membrane biogenesis protein BamB [Rubripirellula lacrimiformis]|uniref:Outer membrane biogenesis protein BamB n=1 Tax=Rubripirellula lacrimiformis TaxID=1930273 RepID=A0A517NDT0_9BACT|nr:PQQ-binding-like beta-propeller repeat protein [Rubripirellula lacrimiformis]QDT05286.1 outer membrane biogenesis protein BamB [Rubripirellula lacrimiformis]
MEDQQEGTPEPQTGGTKVDSTAPTKKLANRWRRAAIAAIVGSGLIATIWAGGDDSDHQYANMAMFVVGAIALIYVALQIHLIALRRGFRYLVPAMVGVVIGGAMSLFRFDGFSGEMMPQFASRFQQPLELATVGPVTEDSAEISAGDSPMVPSPESISEADVSGFLGNQRDAVIDQRLFSVPDSASDITTLWNQGIGQGWSSFAVEDGRAVTLEQRQDQECLTCYQLLDGELLWIQEHEGRHENALGGIGPRSTPTIDDGRVYAQTGTGWVWCTDLESGKVIWTVDLLEIAGWDQLQSEALITWGRAGSPLIVDGMCVLPLGGPAVDSAPAAGSEPSVSAKRSLIALDAETGDIIWRAGDGQISYASPTLMTLAGQRQIVSVNEATVTGHAIDDGRVLWDFVWPGQSNGGANCASAIPAGPDRFVIGKGYGGGSALVSVEADGDAFKATPVWESSSVLKTKFTHACIAGDVAYAISNGSLEAVDVATGESLWRQPRSERLGQGQLMLVGDVLVAQAETGQVVFLDAIADHYQPLLTLPAMDSKTWNIPTVAGRHLLVRNDRQVICFLMPAK